MTGDLANCGLPQRPFSKSITRNSYCANAIDHLSVGSFVDNLPVDDPSPLNGSLARAVSPSGSGALSGCFGGQRNTGGDGWYRLSLARPVGEKQRCVGRDSIVGLKPDGLLLSPPLSSKAAQTFTRHRGFPSPVVLSSPRCGVS